MVVRIQVLFFGQLKDVMGSAATSLDMPEGATLGSVFDHFAAIRPKLKAMERSVVLARNQQFSSRDAELKEGDEVALLPPVSGGAGVYTHRIADPKGHFFALTREAIDTESLKREVLRGEDGAVVDFEGVVRNNTKGRATRFLDYECYEGMAVETMAQIGREIAATHAIGRIAMVHRLGRLEIGEASVVVVVSAPHRKPAFEAALEGINRLKRLVPIWKKEYFEDGEVWVEGEWDDTVVSR